MNGDPKKDEERIFYSALALTSPAAREAYLKEACGDDAELFERVRALLTVDNLEDGFLEDPPTILDVPMLNETPEETAGTVIGRYKLLEKIGEGGMAVVYMAEQREPIRRKVALKIIKLGMETKQVIARFEAERQALAMMDHTNIAKVFDGGATETGRPYFVMELVRGIPITRYCDENRLGTRERLALFGQVCLAVQHAHQKGIIHRDIKPSNVLVTKQDGEAIPKVIDFGIAKATSQRLTGKTLFTRYAQIIGTPAYMSPEQAEFGDSDTDTRTDIYSLGVLLYELLTGTTPFSEEELRKAGYLEMNRVIREEEPTKPSTKLSTLGATLTEVALRREVTPDVLEKLIRGDLDWIVMKSLEKDRKRRYDTASQLLGDIERHLRHEPVLAGPPSLRYRTSKFLQRHAKLVAMLAIVAIALLVGMSVSTSLYLRMRKALYTVSRLEHKVDVDEKLSMVQKLHAQGRHLPALKELESMSKEQGLGSRARLLRGKLLFELKRHREAEVILQPLAQADPEIAAAAHYLLAQINVGVDVTKAREHEALAASVLPDTAKAYVLRAMTALTAEETLQWLDRAIMLDPSHYPARRARALFHYCRVYDEKAVEDVAALIALRPEDSLGYALRAVLRRGAGQLEEALADHNRAIELGENATELAEVYDERYNTHILMGDYESALEDAQRLAESYPQDMGHRLSIVMCLLVLQDYVAVQREYRSIVQTSYLWDRFARWLLPMHVFESLKAGQTLVIPSEMAHNAPFARIQRAIECYDALASHARLLPTRGQGLILFAWSPDGKQLLCGWGGAGGAMRQTIRNTVPSVSSRPGLKIIDVESGGERHVTSAFGGFPAWSPDGRYIAFADRDNNLCLVPAEGGQPKTLVCGDIPYWGPQWSQDSQHLYFRQPWPGGKLCSIKISDPHPIPAELMECPGRFVVCEAEGWMAFDASIGVSMVDLSSGSLLHHCPSPWPLSGWGLRLSPTGRELFFASWWSHINTGPFVLDTREKQLYQVLDLPVDQLLWSPDGSRLAIGASSEVWIMELDPNVPISQRLGREIPDSDLVAYELEKHSQVIAADPLHPENYLERAVAYMSVNRYQKARSDLRQFDALVRRSPRRS